MPISDDAYELFKALDDLGEDTIESLIEQSMNDAQVKRKRRKYVRKVLEIAFENAVSLYIFHKDIKDYKEAQNE